MNVMYECCNILGCSHFNKCFPKKMTCINVCGINESVIHYSRPIVNNYNCIIHIEK